MLAVATCLTGLTEKAFFSLGNTYSSLPQEAFVVNSLAMALMGCAIIVGYIVMREDLRYRGHLLVSAQAD
ncbi:unnamed protein product [Timema podura]|nr:unnamed protein product [Timema podura]